MRADAPTSLVAPLLTSANALAKQSRKHPDGWGIAYLAGDDAQVWRDPHAAADSPFARFLSTDPITSHGHRKADAIRIRDLVESFQAARH